MNSVVAISNKPVMRILHVLPDLQMGGGQKVVLQSIEYLDKKRFINTVCYFYPQDEMKPQFQQQGIPLQLFTHKAWWSFPKVLWAMIRFVQKQQMDLIHIQGTPIDKLYGQLVAFFCRLPVVRTLHGMKPEWRSPLVSFLRRPSPHRLLACCRAYSQRIFDRLLDPLTVQHVIAVSDDVYASWQEYLVRCHFNKQQVTVNYNGVAIGKPEEAKRAPSLRELRQELVLPDSFPILVNVGRLSWAKGQLLLVEMMSHLVTIYPKAQLLLIGSGEDQLQLQTAIKHAGLAKNIKLLGLRNDVSNVLTISDVFVFASFFEGLPLSVLEAMAAAKPVVATELPGLDKLVQTGENGYLIQNRNAVEFALAVEKIVATPQRAQTMGKAGQQLIAKHYNIEHSVAVLAQIYLSILSVFSDHERQCVKGVVK